MCKILSYLSVVLEKIAKFFSGYFFGVPGSKGIPLNGGLFIQAVREAATICPRSCKLTFDLLALKVVSESRVTWATSVPILVFLGLLDLRPMYATHGQTSDVRKTDVRRASSLNAPTLVAGHNLF